MTLEPSPGRRRWIVGGPNQASSPPSLPGGRQYEATGLTFTPALLLELVHLRGQEPGPAEQLAGCLGDVGRDHLQHVAEGAVAVAGLRPPRHQQPVDRGDELHLVVVQVQHRRGRAEDPGLLQEHPGTVEQLPRGGLAFGVAGVEDLVDEHGRQLGRLRQGGNHLGAKIVVGHGYHLRSASRLWMPACRRTRIWRPGSSWP
jgi:hypothetical protein